MARHFIRRESAFRSKIIWWISVPGWMRSLPIIFDEGTYFAVERARQYGKSTMLYLLERQLRERYLVG
ncbi:MAG: hypothetical protein K2P73_20345 [Lachnospiraceae bacterium]|nr:hypothetical protein [Lachnospiraceae bacterium]